MLKPTIKTIWHGYTIGIIGVAVLVLFLFLFGLMNWGDRNPHLARMLMCGGQLQTIGQALLQYAGNNSGKFPDTLPMLVLEGDITSDRFICPAGTETPATGTTTQQVIQQLQKNGHVSYIYIARGLSTTVPAETILVYEPLTHHDGKGINVLFGNGHVDFIDQPQAAKLIAELQSGHNPPRAEMMK